MTLLFNIEIACRALKDISANRAKRKAQKSPTTDILLCMADHFEPQIGKASAQTAQKRLRDWMERYPKIADKHRDFDGYCPKHTFCYPWDEFDAEEFKDLVALCKAGYGEIELHLHHKDDTEATLRAKISEALETYQAHGALSRWRDERPAFAFVHGNWALDNSRIENGTNYCGVNSEIRLLAELGCFVDMTFPAWQHNAQPRRTNAIYYAKDDTAKPKSHDWGEFARVGGEPEGDLLLIQGPLVPYWSGTGKPRPAVDDGDLAHYRRYHPDRFDRWLGAGIHIQGCPDRVYIKLHCHGAADENREVMLGQDLEALFADAEARYNDGKQYRLHYVSAREMFNIARATEQNVSGDWEVLRNYVLKPPTHTVDLNTDGFMQPVSKSG